jgi:hypothetical protein
MPHIVKYTVIYPAGELPPDYELPEGEVLGKRSIEDSFFDTVDALPEVGVVQGYGDRDWQVAAVAEYRSTQVPWTFALVTLSAKVIGAMNRPYSALSWSMGQFLTAMKVCKSMTCATLAI